MELITLFINEGWSFGGGGEGSLVNSEILQRRIHWYTQSDTAE